MVTTPPLRIVFFGTPAFAVPTLDALLHSAHRVVAVVTRHDRPRGRGQRVVDMPVKARAMAAGIPVLQPERLNDAFLQQLGSVGADLGVVVAYGKILTDSILAIPHLGLINVHGSLLPRYRGAAPIHRAIIDGASETGITIMRVVRALDAGPMLATAHRPVGGDETSESVEADLAHVGAGLLVSVVDRLAAGPVNEVPQDERLATYANRLTRDDGIVDWSRSAAAVHNLIRGLHPWPHAVTYYRGRRLILLRSKLDAPDSGTSSSPVSGAARSAEGLDESIHHPPGTILEARGDRLRIATGDGILAVTELQADGRRPMATRDFLAGSHLAPGEVLTLESRGA
jgi:methionyl-tRNA formyltransferase